MFAEEVIKWKGVGVKGELSAVGDVMWRLRFTHDDPQGKSHERTVWLICDFDTARKVRDYVLILLNDSRIRPGMRLNFPCEEYFGDFGSLKRLLIYEPIVNHMMLWKIVLVDQAQSDSHFLQCIYSQIPNRPVDMNFEEFRDACLENLQHLPNFYQIDSHKAASKKWESNGPYGLRSLDREHYYRQPLGYVGYEAHPESKRSLWVYGLFPVPSRKQEKSWEIFRASSERILKRFGVRLQWNHFYKASTDVPCSASHAYHDQAG